MGEYRGKVLLIANTASKCGFTDQYEELEALNQEFKDKGLCCWAFLVIISLIRSPMTTRR